jgi:hypothetical protein
VAKCVAAATVLAAVFLAGAAFGGEPSDADRASARALMQQGYDHLEGGDPRGAAESFRAADALVHVPTTAFALARAEAARGKLIEANEALVRLDNLPLAANESADFATARREGKRLRAELERRIPVIRIVVSGPVDAPLTVAVDDEPIPAGALTGPRLLNPGPHTVTATSGARTKTTKVDVAERSAEVVRIAFDADATIPLPPSPPRPLLGTPAWITIGVGVAAVGTGAVTGALALSAKSSAIQAGCVDGGCPPAAQPDAHRAVAFGNASTAAFSIAGVAAAAAIVEILFFRPLAPKPQGQARGLGITF